jgi:hypothetical protein
MKRYYEIVVHAARHINQPNITFKRLRKVIHLMQVKHPECPGVDETLLRLAWRDFKRVKGGLRGN